MFNIMIVLLPQLYSLQNYLSIQNKTAIHLQMPKYSKSGKTITVAY